ncbi:DUF2207 domain-containing protein [Gracilimonas sp. BCB1]|uniref:DUF2207 domain-containing protein n=1 Tax=Gracilimonas sp. BCB1 TaxID=3152362 RepID=UPI0032D8E1E2
MRISKFFFLFVITFTLNFLGSTALAKEYAIPELKIEVSINPDGTVTITEHRTYVFDGDFSWANYELPKSGFSAIRNIQVSENGSNFINLNSEEPGTFLVEESNRSYNIKWFYDAEDEERVFSISYTLEGAVVIGPEWSEFFWNYAAAGREKSTEKLSILFQLPETVADSSVHSWVREPAWEIESTSFDKGLQFTGFDISRGQAVVIRTVFPASVFDASRTNVTDADFSLVWARNDEANYREQQIAEAEERERMMTFGIELAVVLAGLSILCFVYFYRKYGSRHQINLSLNESLMVPGKQQPATIGWLLMHRTITGGHVTATLLDLARRGYFVITEAEPEEDDSWFSNPNENNTFIITETDQKPDSSLAEWEISLLNFVKKRISEGHSDIKKVFKFTDSEVSKWFSEWKTELKSFAEEQGWIDRKSYRGAWLNFGLQMVLMLAALVGVFMLHPVAGLSAIVVFISSVLSLVIIRRTPKGEELYKSWTNYQQALKNAKDYSIPDHHLGRHFIYSIALGLSKDHIEHLFEQNPAAVSTITWMMIIPGSDNSPAGIATSFSNLAATGTVSSGGGFSGGGASAGSAGGGASGGAG